MKIKLKVTTIIVLAIIITILFIMLNGKNETNKLLTETNKIYEEDIIKYQENYVNAPSSQFVLLQNLSNMEKFQFDADFMIETPKTYLSIGFNSNDNFDDVTKVIIYSKGAEIGKFEIFENGREVRRVNRSININQWYHMTIIYDNGYIKGILTQPGNVHLYETVEYYTEHDTGTYMVFKCRDYMSDSSCILKNIKVENDSD